MKPLPVVPAPDAARSATTSSSHTSGMVADPARTAELKPRIVEALATVYDPEIPVNIYELGLVYDIIIESSGAVGIRMTLTAPNCPAAQFLPAQVGDAVAAVAGVTDVTVEIVWDPPWDRDRMSPAAKLQLGMF